MSLSKDDFRSEVVNLYRNLYDLIFLRTHPLTDVLIPDVSISRQEKSWQVHHLLLDVIEELNPGENAPMSSREWRRYQLMVLRFVDRLEPEAVADELTISRRQFFREQKDALETIAGILWNRYADREPTADEMPPAVEEQASLQRMELLRLETARLGQSSRYARVNEVVAGVLPLLLEIMQQRELTIHQEIPATLPVVAINQSLLRQMLLGILGYLTESAAEATLKLTAQTQVSTVTISALIEPEVAVQPIDQADARKRISTLEEMAKLGESHLAFIYADDVIVGFDIKLSAVQRTVLVVDDNEDVLELFTRYLTPLNYRVITAQTALETVERASQLQPHAITLDLMMPDQDGWDVLQNLLNRPETQHIPIIVCSVLKEKNLALSLGATAFLEKPVSRQALLTALQALEES